MSFQFVSLASGSRGNASLVANRDTLIMIDCGLPLKTLEARLDAVGRSARDIDALLITHEHSDHVRGLGAFQRRYNVPLFATPGTGSALLRGLRRNSLNCHRELEIGSIAVEPFPVPHDAREPCQFVFRAGHRRFGYLTDTGHVTPTIADRLADCHALALEFNHDPVLLANGSYPESVKARVGSRLGHLSNGQSAELLAKLKHPALEWVVGLHVSERNNDETMLRAAVAPVLESSDLGFHIASQSEPTVWLKLA